jgi:hypothetical protein
VERTSKRLAQNDVQWNGWTGLVRYCKSRFGLCAYDVLLWRMFISTVFA